MVIEKNKVVIIGDDHHNPLNLARSFGVNNIEPYGIIIVAEPSKAFSYKSKYWKKVWLVKNIEEAKNILRNSFNCESEKPVLIPTSDDAAQLIDAHLEELKIKYIVPSINGTENSIVELMDKFYQIEFINKYGIPMATSKIMYEASWKDDILFMKYPCIVKPVSSYEGLKSDIKKCDNKIQLEEYLTEIFYEKKYKRILVQEFIDFDYEIEFVGAFTPKERSYFFTRTHRGWPIIGGTNSFFSIIKDKELELFSKKVLDAFEELNFSGLFDIEVFRCGDKILLNEINWRNTGNVFFSLGTNVHYAVIWYGAVTGQNTDDLLHYNEDVELYAMNEATDLRHVVFNGYSFREWNKERRKSKSFALWFKGDNRPTFKRYIQLLCSLIKH